MYTDLETWLHDDADEVLFNVYVKKHIYTPYEQEQKFSDESTEELELQNVHIVKAVELPDKDVLLGFQWFSEDPEEPTQSYIYYYKLSEIRLVEVYGFE